NFAEPCGFALELAEIKQLGAAHLVGANDLDFVEHLGIKREDALYALAKADLADGEAALRAPALGDHGPFKGLYALLVAFLDLHLDSDSIARVDVGNVLALQLGSQFFHDWML